MSIWKKIGNVAKKALPFVSAAVPLLGMGGSLSGVAGAIGRIFGGQTSSGSPSSAQGWNSEIGLDGQSGDAPRPTYTLPQWTVTAPGGGPGSAGGLNFAELLKVAAPAVGALASGGAAAYGQREANVANAEMAQKQMDFQERMSNTQWQRGVKDMQSAGLNPMLAYSQGGASSPSGATASMANELGTGVTSALQAMTGIQQLQATQAQIGNVEEQTRRTAAEVDQVRALTGFASAQEAEAWARIRDQYPAQRDLWGAQTRKYTQETQTEKHRTTQAGYTSQLEGLKIPGGENEAERQRKNRDWFTGNMSGYIGDAYTGAGVVERLGGALTSFLPKRLISTVMKKVGG